MNKKIKSPLVSVIMPAYNCENYISEAIHSILNQTFRNFELIIIDDGSIDSTFKIINQHMDKRIKIYKNKTNLGIAATRNFGIEKAVGIYITMLDSDDVAEETRLSRQVEFLDNNLEYGLCCSNVQSIDKNGTIISPKWWNCEEIIPLEWELLWSNPIAQSTVMLRKSILDNNKLKYDLDYPPAEDYKLWCSLFTKCRMFRLNDVLLSYRVLDGSAFRSSKERALKLSIKANENLFEKNLSIDVPYFHKHLLSFSEGLNDNIWTANIEDVYMWIFSLVNMISALFEWDDKEKKRVMESVNGKMLKGIIKNNQKFMRDNRKLIIWKGKMLNKYLTVKELFSLKVFVIKENGRYLLKSLKAIIYN